LCFILLADGPQVIKPITLCTVKQHNKMQHPQATQHEKERHSKTTIILFLDQWLSQLPAEVHYLKTGHCAAFLLLLLQEDINEEPAPRMFWPHEVWGHYAERLEEFKEPCNRDAAVQCLNHLVSQQLLGPGSQIGQESLGPQSMPTWTACKTQAPSPYSQCVLFLNACSLGWAARTALLSAP
jgi:hypothetical protein